MISYVKGILEELETDAAIIDVGGIGFRVYTPVSQELMKKGVGSEVKLYTYMNVREDAMILFGFLDKVSLELFEKLIGVTGVGPRSGLAILSTLSTQQLVGAIISEDKKTLSSVPGIGQKTASRIILDLKDKVGAVGASSGEGITAADLGPVGAEGPAQEAVMALSALGYSQSDASRAVAKVTAVNPGLSVEDIIRSCLKLLY